MSRGPDRRSSRLATGGPDSPGAPNSAKPCFSPGPNRPTKRQTGSSTAPRKQGILHAWPPVSSSDHQAGPGGHLPAGHGVTDRGVGRRPAGPAPLGAGVLVSRGDVRLLLPVVGHPALADHARLALPPRAVPAPPAGHARCRRVQPDQPLRGQHRDRRPLHPLHRGRPGTGHLRRAECDRRRTDRLRGGLVRHRLGRPRPRDPTARTSGSTCWSRRSTRPRPRGTTSTCGSPTKRRPPA